MSPQSETPALSAREDGPFRILQVTDLHNDEGTPAAEATYDTIQALVDLSNPDFVAVTGDIWCGDETPKRAEGLMVRDIAFFESLGIPWGLTLGNHDYVAEEWDLVERLRCLTYAVAPEGGGPGAFHVPIIHPDGDVLWDLFFLNSGSAWDPDGHTRWFRMQTQRLQDAREYTAPALVFVHIPLEAYERARTEGRCTGDAHEEVLHWGDEGEVLDVFAEAGNVRACFAGHSHVNDFHFVERGIHFNYGRATGVGGYGGDILAKGGKLITLEPESLHAQTLFPNGETAHEVTHVLSGTLQNRIPD